MIIKGVKFVDADNNITSAKVISCGKLRSILHKLPMHYLIHTSAITGNILVKDKDLSDVGYIDIAEDKYINFLRKEETNE